MSEDAPITVSGDARGDAQITFASLPVYRCPLGHEGKGIGIRTEDDDGRVTNHCMTCYIAWIRATFPEVTMVEVAE